MKGIALSGGIDSTALAFQQVDQGTPLHGIFVNGGQRSALRQQAAAERLGLMKGFGVKIAPLQGAAELFLPIVEPPHVLFTEGPPSDVPIQPLDDQCWDSMWLVVTTGMYIANLGFDSLLYAVTKEDIERVRGLEDGMAAAEKVIQFNTGNSKFKIEAPLIHSSHADVLAIIGDRIHDVRTWSCYWGGLYHCGKCAGCEYRKNRFAAAGVEDKTEYSMDYVS